jgi:hypothetical protein
MIPLQETAPPPTKDELLDALKETVGDIVKNDISGDVEPEKLWQFRMARKNDLYWRQLQYVSPHLFEGGLADFSAIGSPLAGKDSDTGSGLYDYVQNIYRGYGRKFIAVLGQRSPNVVAVPDNPDDEQSMKATRMANTAAAILRAQWDADQRNLELMMHLWKSGTTFAYTPWIVDGKKYGTSQEPKIEVREVPVGEASYACIQCGEKTPESEAQATAACPSCGRPFSPEDRQDAETVSVPEVTGTAQYENGAVEFHLYNIMFVSCPFFVTGIEDTPWLTLEYEEYKGRLMQAFPKLREDSPDSIGGDSAGGIGTVTRDSASSPMGVPTPHRGSRLNYKRAWLKTEMYESVKDEAKRKMLYENFPEGMKATLVQGKVVALENERLSDVWSCCKPETSEYLFADPIGQDLVPIQDLVNDVGINIPAETIERGLPITFADSRVIDVEQWNSKQSMPAEVMPVMPATGEDVASSFWQTQPARFSDQAIPWLQGVLTEAIKGVGVVPEIFGASIAPTARQAEINKNAALMQLGTTWLYVRKFWEKTYENGVKMMARFGSGTATSAQKNASGYQAMVLNLSELQDSGWHFEAEESIPMTWGQQRDLLMFMMEKPLPVLQAFGFTHPLNVDKNKSLLGMTGYYTPGVDQVEKTMEAIRKLSQAAPIQKLGPDGLPDIQPSIPPDQFEDDHALAAQTVQAYCNSSAGRQLRESSPDGYANVAAYGMAHLKMLQPPVPPPPPPPPPKLSVSAKIENLSPEERQIVDQKFGLVGAPPPPPPPGVAAPAPGAPAAAPAPHDGGAPMGGPPPVSIPPGGPTTGMVQ